MGGGLSHVPVLQLIFCSRGGWESVGFTSPQLAFLLEVIYF